MKVKCRECGREVDDSELEVCPECGEKLCTYCVDDCCEEDDHE